MVLFKESKDLVLKYIRKHGGKATKNNVVDYMSSDEVEEKFRTSRMTTWNMIKELEEGNRIKVKKKGERQGQSHYLIINDKSVFDQINNDLSSLENQIDKIIESTKSKIRSGKIKGEHGIPTPTKEQMLIVYKLAIQLALVKQDIMSEDDRKFLIGKIHDLILSIVLKNKVNTIAD